MTQPILVQNFSRTQAREAAGLRDRGYTFKDIAKIYDKNRATVARYLRILDRYGIDAFPHMAAKDRPKAVAEQANSRKRPQSNVSSQGATRLQSHHGKGGCVLPSAAGSKGEA